MFQSHVITNRDVKRLVSQGMEKRDTFVYLLMSISKLCSNIKFKSQNIATTFFIVHFYNSTSSTLIENIKMRLLYQRRLNRLLWFYSV